MLPGRGIIDHLGDVGRVVPDTLEILGDEQKMRGVADVLRIFHHVCEQGPEDRIIEIIDRIVALANPVGLGVLLGLLIGSFINSNFGLLPIVLLSSIILVVVSLPILTRSASILSKHTQIPSHR